MSSAQHVQTDCEGSGENDIIQWLIQNKLTSLKDKIVELDADLDELRNLDDDQLTSLAAELTTNGLLQSRFIKGIRKSRVVEQPPVQTREKIMVMMPEEHKLHLQLQKQRAAFVVKSNALLLSQTKTLEMHDAMKQRVHDTFSEIHEALNLKQQEFIAKLQTLNDDHINKLAALRSDCQKGIDTMKNVESQCKDKWTQNVNRMTLNDDKKEDDQSASELISQCLRTLTGSDIDIALATDPFAKFQEVEEQMKSTALADIDDISVNKVKSDDVTRLKLKNRKLAKELMNLENMAKEDVTAQQLQIEKMQREIIGLASRNNALETEKDDLIAMLEERDYENQMLKTGFGLHRENMDDFKDAVQPNEYDENLETLAFIDDVSMVASGSSATSTPKAKKSTHKEVADVVREYLHLTASVVNMKYPRIQHIQSEELINKVKNYQFYEYHDMMVNIMRIEEKKLQKEAETKRRKERQQLRANGQRQKQKSEHSGFLGGIFGGSQKKKSKISHETRKEKIVSPRNKTYEFKLVLLGDTSVGKSSIVIRFVKGQFSEYQEQTLGAAFVTQTIPVQDCTVKFEIWDTAGQERYHSLAPMYYRGAAAAIVVYDITSQESFHRAKSWVKELQRQGHPDIVIALAGNKLDRDEEREVGAADVKHYADDNSLYFIEISAKTNVNVRELFLAIARQLPKELKDGAKKKITGIPSDKESEELNAMSFQSIPLSAV